MLAWYEILTNISDHRLEKPPPRIATHFFYYSLNLEISLHLLWQSFEWTLTRPTNINCDKILFSYSEMIQVFFLFLFYVMLCYLFCYYKFLQKIFIITGAHYYYFFFIKIIFIFFMFRDAPGCSGFLVLSTPLTSKFSNQAVEQETKIRLILKLENRSCSKDSQPTFRK